MPSESFKGDDHRDNGAAISLDLIFTPIDSCFLKDLGSVPNTSPVVYLAVVAQLCFTHSPSPSHHRS
jgi:hypothetical protein